MNNNGPLKLKAQNHEGKGKLDYIIILSMRNVCLERGQKSFKTSNMASAKSTLREPYRSRILAPF